MLPLTKNSLSLIHAQKMIEVICDYYLENPEDAKRWMHDLTSDANISPSNSLLFSSNSSTASLSPSSYTLFTDHNAKDNITNLNLLFGTKSVNGISQSPKNADLSTIYFSSLPTFINDYTKDYTKGYIYNKPLSKDDANGKIHLSNDLTNSALLENEMSNFSAFISKCKRKLHLNFSIKRFFPSNADVNLFQASRINSKRQRENFDAVARANIENSMKVKGDDFYLSMLPNHLISNAQFSRQKYPHFLDQKETTNRCSLRSIVLGDLFMDVWYNSPFPTEYVPSPLCTLWICPWCLKYCSPSITAQRHKLKCYLNRPPGKEIHRQKSKTKKDNILSVFELDGSTHKLYCQNLCLLAKCFLDHKILYYDVNSFVFYVLTECHQDVKSEVSKSFGSMRVVGYFSKERNIDVYNNVSCIVIFPAYQGLGYGQYLIDFSK